MCVSLAQFLPRGCKHSPVLKFLAVDAHSSLVALGDTHLVSAALNLLTGVLGGVYVWGKTENEMWHRHCLIFYPFIYLSLPIILHLQSQIPNLSVPFAQHNLRVSVNGSSGVELSCTITYFEAFCALNMEMKRLSNRMNQINMISMQLHKKKKSYLWSF